jgi:hypothetical protein
MQHGVPPPKISGAKPGPGMWCPAFLGAVAHRAKAAAGPSRAAPQEPTVEYDVTRECR